MDSQEYHIEALQENHWWFRGRNQLLKSLVDDFAQGHKVQKINTIVDVGCGVGLNADTLKGYTENLIGIDPDDIAIGYCQNKGYNKVIQSTLEELTPEKIQQPVDVVVAMDILEHLPDDLLGVKRIFQLVSVGGMAIITAPAFPSIHGLQDIVSHHYRRYKRKQLSDLCRAAGFEIVRTTYFNTWLFAPIALIRYAMRFWKPANLQSENQFNSPLINSILTRMFALEMGTIIRGMNYPFGVSLLVVVKKTENNF